jgi:hypothetical protein
LASGKDAVVERVLRARARPALHVDEGVQVPRLLVERVELGREDADAAEQRLERGRLVDPLDLERRLLVARARHAEAIADLEVCVVCELLLDNCSKVSELVDGRVGALLPVELVDLGDRVRIDAGDLAILPRDLGQPPANARRDLDFWRTATRWSRSRRRAEPSCAVCMYWAVT